LLVSKRSTATAEATMKAERQQGDRRPPERTTRHWRPRARGRRGGTITQAVVTSDASGSGSPVPPDLPKARGRCVARRWVGGGDPPAADEEPDRADDRSTLRAPIPAGTTTSTAARANTHRHLVQHREDQRGEQEDGQPPVAEALHDGEHRRHPEQELGAQHPGRAEQHEQGPHDRVPGVHPPGELSPPHPEHPHHQSEVPGRRGDARSGCRRGRRRRKA